MKKRKILAALAAALLAALPMGNALTASATTTDDVIAAAYAAGWPDWLVQQAVNMYAGGSYTSEQCDKAIAQIYQYNDEVGEQIAKEFGVAPPNNMTTTTPAPAVTTTPTAAGGNESTGENQTTVTTTVTAARPSDNKFINMTLDEKKEYLNSMTQEEKEAFVNTMTDSERNSVIKQLSASDKASLISNFMEVGDEFGISFNIDELSSDSLQISAHDENGNLVNVTSMGITIDPTGNSYTLPIAAGVGLLTLSIGGIIILMRKNKTE